MSTERQTARAEFMRAGISKISPPLQFAGAELVPADIGNQSLQWQLREAETGVGGMRGAAGAPSPPHQPSGFARDGPVLRRSPVASGGTTASGGNVTKHSGPGHFGARFRSMPAPMPCLGGVRDPEEKAADRVAATLTGPMALGAQPAVPRRGMIRPATPALLSQPGAPLPNAVRGRFEQRLGTDLSPIRLHRGQEASAATSAVGATAFAHGLDIAFGAGAPTPETVQGERLLAHEVAHTLQNDSGAVIRRQPAPPAPPSNPAPAPPAPAAPVPAKLLGPTPTIANQYPTLVTLLPEDDIVGLEAASDTATPSSGRQRRCGRPRRPRKPRLPAPRPKPRSTCHSSCC